jgi:hypothetical protein
MPHGIDDAWRFTRTHVRTPPKSPDPTGWGAVCENFRKMPLDAANTGDQPAQRSLKPTVRGRSGVIWPADAKLNGLPKAKVLARWSLMLST